MPARKKSLVSPFDEMIIRHPDAQWFTLTFRPRTRADFGADRTAAAKDCRARGALLYAIVGDWRAAPCPLEYLAELP